MRKILFILALSALAVFDLTGQRIWTEEDKKNLIEGLKTTRSEVLKEVEALTQDQLLFKPDSTSWSIAQVLEHLAVYEEYLYWDLFYGQYTPERPELVAKTKENDAQFLAYATDQSKGNSPWIALPIGRFENKQDLINFFTRFRDEVISYIDQTDCDFRLHFIYRAPGSGIWTERDLHQNTLIWIAHTERHTHQIKYESSLILKAMPNSLIINSKSFDFCC